MYIYYFRKLTFLIAVTNDLKHLFRERLVLGETMALLVKMAAAV